MEKKAQSSEVVFVILSLMIAGIFLILGLIMIGSVNDNIDYESGAGSQTILSANSTETSISPTGSGVISDSATYTNRTWLEFDGNNDVLTITDNSYTTLSFWYKNSTQSVWQNIINSSGTIYVNGSSDGEYIYPVYDDGTYYYFGKSDGSTFVDIEIDEIRFYNGSINSTTATEIYEDGR